jgi:hypothetical protein
MSVDAGCILTLFLAGTARMASGAATAVRARKAGATSGGVDVWLRAVPRALRAVTAVAAPLAMRAIPTTATIENHGGMRPSMPGHKIKHWQPASVLLYNPFVY